MTVNAPGAADAALTVGAVDDGDLMAYFSSRGPRLGDGALKPDVVAPGVGITAARAAGTSLGTPSTSSTRRSTARRWPRLMSPVWPRSSRTRTRSGTVKGSRPRSRPRPFPSPTRPASTRRRTCRRSAGRRGDRPGLGVAQPRVLHLAADRSADDADEADLHEHGRRSGDARPLARLAGRSRGGPGRRLALGLDAHGSGRRRGFDRRAPRPEPAGYRVPFSGVVIASNPTGTVARTAFGFGLESEHHDLTVQLKPRSGTQSGTHVIGLASLDGSFFDQRVVTGSAAQSVTWRVPPGTYSAGAISFELAADGAKEGVLTYDPEVAVHSTTTITLDGDEAARFGHSVDQPVSSDGQFMGVFWNTNTGGTGFTFAGNADRLYAKPLRSSATGTVESYLNWMLSQPDAELDRTGLPAPAEVTGRRPRPREQGLPRRRRGLGRCAADRVRSQGDCARRRRLRRPRACSRSAFGRRRRRGRGLRGCRSRLRRDDRRGGAAGLRSAAVRRARRCSSTTGRPRIVTHESPHYIYDLAGAWNGFVPDGAVLEGATRKLGAIVERYDSLGPAAKDGHQVWAMPLGWMPGGYAAFGLVRPVAVPTPVTHYVSPRRGVGANVSARRRSASPKASSPRRGTSSPPVRRRGRVVRRADHLARRPLDRTVGLQLALPPGGLLPARNAAVRRPGGHRRFLYLDEFAGQLFQDGELIAEATIRSSCRHSCRRSATTTGSSTRSSATTPSGSDRAGRRQNRRSAPSGRRAITR